MHVFALSWYYHRIVFRQPQTLQKSVFALQLQNFLLLESKDCRETISESKQ